MDEHEEGAEGHAQGREPGRDKPGNRQGNGGNVVARGPQEVAMEPAAQAASDPQGIGHGAKIPAETDHIRGVLGKA